MSGEPVNEFAKAASEESDESLFGELVGFLRHNKKWWLLPILLSLLVFGLLAWMSTTAAAPFIYTLF